MDHSNFESLKKMAIKHECTGNNIRMFLSFSKQSDVREVPDPYYGGSNGFDNVIDLIEAASKGLISELLGDKNSPLRINL